VIKLSNKQSTFDAYVETCLDAFGKQTLSLEDEMTAPNGEILQTEVTVSSLLDKAEASAGVVIVVHDTTLTKQQHELLHFQATHDALTNLLNRNEFELRLVKALKTAMTEDAVHTLCFLDLDQFKLVNDVAGHIAGDELLVQLSHLLNQQIWNRDVLARIGGDEFAVLMEHCDVDDAVTKAESLRSLIEEFRFVWEQHVFSVGVSIGVVQINKLSVNTTQLMQKADLACYAAKERGRNRVHVYQENDEVLAKHEGDMYWASQVQAAIDANQFTLFAQRIAPVATDDEWMYEVLVRMIGHDGQQIPPGAFLPAVERYNLAHKLDRWVIDHTLTWLDSHAEALNKLQSISINLSGATLGDTSMLAFIRARLVSAGDLAAKVTFEITETHAVSNLREATEFIKELKILGCRFALDDFGSGLSSFAYLKNLPVDYLKIDGVFVKDVLDDPIDAAMVRSIVDIGRVMEMETVAEFVENEEIRRYLNEINVDYVQGYGVEKPMPIDDILLSLPTH
jgi:diguanylate cyclase (GGDEF)-like protein